MEYQTAVQEISEVMLGSRVFVSASGLGFEIIEQITDNSTAFISPQLAAQPCAADQHNASLSLHTWGGPVLVFT